MTEKTLDAIVNGNGNSGGKLVDQAKSLDSITVQEVMDDLEADPWLVRQVPREDW